MEKVIVIGISYWKFPDGQTGEIKEGATVHYISDYAFTETDKKGMFPIKVSTTPEIYKELTVGVNGGENHSYPAWVEMSHINVPDGKGKATPRLVGVKYLGAIDLRKVVSNPLTK